MPNLKVLEQSLPIAPLKIAALESCTDLAKKVMTISYSFVMHLS